jgi:hypothetical protein
VYAASYADPTNMKLVAAAQAESQKPVFRAAATQAKKCECSYAPALAERAAAVKLPAKPQWPVIKDPAIENLGRPAVIAQIIGEALAKQHAKNPPPEPPDTYALALKARKENG